MILADKISIFRHTSTKERTYITKHEYQKTYSVYTYRDPRPPKGRSKILTGGRLMMLYELQ